MVQNSAAGSQPDPAHTKLHKERLILSPDPDGFYRCKKCNRSHLCPEPCMFHEQGCNVDASSAVPTLHEEPSGNQNCASGDTKENTHNDLKHEAVPKPYVRNCRGVWCGNGTHYVQVDVSQPMGLDSTIRQVDEVKTFTVDDFFQMEFSRTEEYEDTVKKIKKFDERCCRPVQDIIIAKAPEHRSPNAGTDSILSSYKIVLKWLQSYFSSCIPTHRKSNRWTTSTCPSTPDLRPNSSCPSTEAIIADNGHRLKVEKSDSNRDMGYRKPTADMPTHMYIGSVQTFTQDHSAIYGPSLNSAEATDTFLLESVTGVVAVNCFYSTCEGVHGCGVLVLTHSDTITLLKRVSLSALINHERIAGQLQDILGKPAYNRLLRFEEKRALIRGPVYNGILPDSLQIRVGKELPLNQCPPILQAEVRSILNF
ncbi:hypothetical protein PtrM4_105270 [Pyrenophora tritici-repentis]|uniref:Uncharacterized protein n=1 Tax=Pyrenophora tritici-repentis TaxID=45151 RepID=A0A834RVI6_9PLEO|nr:hypothetical protein PtrM4_105270 [Pyrenophora tritici-repentis]KAI0569303.1 hypothetical protein Alg215_11720 [Pyrenophora tritici-repentis]